MLFILSKQLFSFLRYSNFVLSPFPIFFLPAIAEFIGETDWRLLQKVMKSSCSKQEFKNLIK